MTRAVLAGEVLAVFLGETGVPLGESVTFTRSFAGAESNTAIALSRQGVPATLLGRIGADALGRAALRHLRGEGVDVSALVVDPGHPTGLLVRSVSPSGGEVVYGRRGSAGAHFNVADVPATVFDGAGLFHCSGITPMLSADAADACARAVDLARAAGATISFDPNIRRRMAGLQAWRETLTPLLRTADVILTGSDEAVALTGTSSSRGAAEHLHRARGAVVVLKDGARGASAYDGRQWRTAEAVPVPVLDPVGAGDAFDAGFLTSWLETADLRQALDHGARLGAMSVSARGDTAGIADSAVGALSGDVVR